MTVKTPKVEEVLETEAPVTAEKLNEDLRKNQEARLKMAQAEINVILEKYGVRITASPQLSFVN